MKDHVKAKVKSCNTHDEVKNVVDDYIDYYNNDGYQWDLLKLSRDCFKACINSKLLT